MKTVLAIAAATAVGITGCAPTTMGRNIASSDNTRLRTVEATSAPRQTTKPTDPYSSTGTWLVPDEIKPGTYRVNLNPGEDSGYGAVCGDYECNPFGEPGMLSNDNYYGPGVMVIPPSAVSVELKRINLTPMGGQG